MTDSESYVDSIPELEIEPVAFAFEDLTPEVRALMVEEIAQDEKNDAIYRSSYLTQQAQGRRGDMLRAAVQTGSDATLASELRQARCLNATTTRKSSKGKVYTASVPHNAAEVLAQGEFNRYFCRGLARFAIGQNIPRLQVYRAKAVFQPRPESEQKIGLLVDPETILIDLRKSIGVEPALGIPPGPGSGISLRIPKNK